jgi:hypothetical protein
MTDWAGIRGLPGRLEKGPIRLARAGVRIAKSRFARANIALGGGEGLATERPVPR